MAATQLQSIASIGSGKFYVELVVELFDQAKVYPSQTILGISATDIKIGSDDGPTIGVNGYGSCWQNGAEPDYFQMGDNWTLVPGDVVRIWMDIDNSIWWAGLNGQVIGQPDEGTNPVNKDYPLEGAADTWFARFSTHVFTGEVAAAAIRVRLCAKPSQMTYPPSPGWKTLEV